MKRKVLTLIILLAIIAAIITAIAMTFRNNSTTHEAKKQRNFDCVSKNLVF